MTWQRIDRYHEQSGPYRVSAAKTAQGWQFSAWRSTADEARALCKGVDREL